MSEDKYVHLTITLSGGTQVNLHGEKNKIHGRAHFVEAVDALKRQAVENAIQKAIRDHQNKAIVSPGQADQPISPAPVMSVFHSFISLDGKRKDVDILALQVVEEWEAPLDGLCRMKESIEGLIKEMS